MRSMVEGHLMCQAPPLRLPPERRASAGRPTASETGLHRAPEAGVEYVADAVA